MVFQDTQFQLNDIKSQLRTLQNQLRSQQPQTAKASPIAPLTNATSSGGAVAGVGMSTDAFSRALQTATQSALASAESLQYAFGGSNVFNHGSTVQTITTSEIRPDPVVGQQFRIGGGGLWINNTAGAVTMQMSFVISGVTILILDPPVTVNAGVPQAWFFTMLMNVAPQAGPTGAVNCTSAFHVGPFVGAATTYVADAPIALANLVAPFFTIQSTSSVASASITTRVDEMIYESLGFRQG